MTRRTGRPRLAPITDPDVDPAEQILAAAASLFTERGFASTTTREIAQAAGIQQPSLYYWFPTKWDILNRLVEAGIVDSAAFAGRIRRKRAPALVRLYAVLLFDTRHVCASPYDLSFLWNAPELKDPRLTYRPHLATLHRVVEELVAKSFAAGESVAIDPVLARRAILAATSATMTVRLPADQVEPMVRSGVRFAMRGIAAPGVDLDQVETAAQALSKP